MISLNRLLNGKTREIELLSVWMLTSISIKS
jgi:hypothetical protein